ncbi:MAG: ABC transporter permease [Chloroflexi bacterium]|nr:ABC transporter permease [Chloroflexota bacterium]OJV98344.1 MAG: hypothetical protein BGO39_16345 [Chloroflexi bacterium 54-19]
MLYKEWLFARQKLLFVLGLYAGAAVLVVTVFSPNYLNQQVDPVFHTWILITLFLTGAMGIFGGVDTVAEEADKGTISFLLTRPVSRNNIFLTKLALNAAVIAAIFGLSSVIVFFLDKIPRVHLNYTRVTIPDGWYLEATGTVAVPTTGVWEALVSTTAVILLGLVFLCLSALVSVFVRNTITAILLTFIFTGVFLAAIAVFNDHFIKSRIDYLVFMNPNILPLLILPVIVFLLAGLASFKHKEF